MKKTMLIAFALVLIGTPSTAFAISFLDDFDDGDLAGWTEKAGNWTNPGDHLLSSDLNYGVIWIDDSFGLDQLLTIDAYFDDGSTTKSASLRLRSGKAASGGNPFYDHGYHASVQRGLLRILNTTAPHQHRLLGSVSGLDSLQNEWLTISFSVVGTGNDTNLKLWVDDVLYLDVFDTFGSPHDDGGYLALGSSNHINRRIKYDNMYGEVDMPPVPEPASLLLLGVGLACLAGIRARRRRA